jgi:hypothetical protein
MADNITVSSSDVLASESNLTTTASTATASTNSTTTDLTASTATASTNSTTTDLTASTNSHGYQATYTLDGTTFTIDTLYTKQPAEVIGQTNYGSLWVSADASESIGYVIQLHYNESHVLKINEEIGSAFGSGDFSLRFRDDTYDILELRYGDKYLNLGTNENETHLLMADRIKLKNLEQENNNLRVELDLLRRDNNRLVADLAAANQHLKDIDDALAPTRRLLNGTTTCT